MKKHLLLTVVMLFAWNFFVLAQNVQVKDPDNNLLLEIKDEGSVGAILLPHSSAAPGVTINKLYNVDGSLFFNGIKLGGIDSSALGWNYLDPIIILRDSNDHVGIGTTSPISKLSVNGSGHADAMIYGRATEVFGRAVFGEATQLFGQNYGGYFVTASYSGRGVYGLATNTDPFGVNHGGYFESAGVIGRGVYGYASSGSNTENYGGYFQSEGGVGRAVFGLANSTGNTENFGGWFKAKGIKGRGVYGVASNAGGENYGGYFESAGGTGRGVYGYASSGSNNINYGGYFLSEGTTGRAVFGLANSTANAVNFGGWFKSKGEKGRGVYGEASDVNGVNYGGYFLAKGISGRAVFGLAEYSPGGENFGGWFKGKGTSKGTGVYAWGKKYDFYADGDGIDYASSSSRRWKTDIVAIDHPLEKIKALRGVYYNWKEDRGGRHDIGMIAEEVGAVIPEIVEYEDNGIDATAMDYSKLTPLLIEAMKELNTKVDKLALENELLRKEIRKLKHR